MEKKVKINSYAKINLSLNITGCINRYHTLDSVVTSVDLSDVIILHARRDKLVNIYMKGIGTEIPMQDNNAFKAANLFVQHFSTNGADITIYKNIPIGAGLGGSSADSAGVLRGLKIMYDITDDEEIIKLANQCGSDTAYMLEGGFARLTQRGEVIKKINTDMKLNMLLLVPANGVSTAECFKKYDEMPEKSNNSSDIIEKALTENDLDLISDNLYNSMLIPAAKLNPEILNAIEELKEFSPKGICMTGSGSGVFAIFENDQFVKWAKSRYNGKSDCYEIKSVDPEKVRQFKSLFALQSDFN